MAAPGHARVRVVEPVVVRAVRLDGGPLEPNGASLTPAAYAFAHRSLGNPARLPLTEPVGLQVPASTYDAYRASAQHVSADGRTVRFTAQLKAGDVLLDTFGVRTLLVPSVVVLLGRWNWWPSRLSRQPPAPQPGKRPRPRSGWSRGR